MRIAGVDLGAASTISGGLNRSETRRTRGSQAPLERGLLDRLGSLVGGELDADHQADAADVDDGIGRAGDLARCPGAADRPSPGVGQALGLDDVDRGERGGRADRVAGEGRAVRAPAARSSDSRSAR